MSQDGFERWSYNTLNADYDEDKVAYTGLDMEEAYQHGCGYRERAENLEKRIEQLEGLLSANVRVMKAEIRREMEEEKKKPT